MLVQAALDGGRRDQDRFRRSVEPADVTPEQLGRQVRPLGNIFRKLGVIGGGEREAAPEAPAPGGEAERTFGRDMERLRRRGFDPAADRPARGQSEPDLG
jgi:hypothetical protein